MSLATAPLHQACTSFAAQLKRKTEKLKELKALKVASRGEELIEVIIRGIQEKKGKGIVVANLNGIEGAICNYFVVCQGNSPSQVEAVVESVGDFARLEHGEKPAHVVGLENAQWVAMDYGDVMVHVFLPDVREYYDLEHLWDDAQLKAIPDLD